ncbi:MAG TPA: ACT domain-containing protein [Clostridia bacterium]|nr:ACT domain-containing protein [Clostridia bacterium]
MVKQISVFLENKEGRLADVTKTLGDHGISIRALCIADTTDFGILRLIVNNPDLAYKVLKEAEFAVSLKDVMAIAIQDQPGSLSKALALLQGNNVVIEYMYAYLGRIENKAIVIMKVSEYDRAVSILNDGGFEVITAEDVYNF